jgi:hypothetical protein
MAVMNRSRAWLALNWWWLVPVLLALVLMLPRMSSAQFGLEDDGASIAKAQQMLDGTWSPSDDLGAGRFRPLYWLSFGLVYGLAGQRPFWFFFYNTLLLAAIALLIMHLMRRHAARKVQACLAGVLFVLSGPVIESFYTLTKIEPLQVLLILSAIALALRAADSRNLARTVLTTALAWLAAFLAFLCKETTLVMIPIILVWLGAAWIFKAPRAQKTGLGVLLAAFLAASLAFWLARIHYVVPHGPGYPLDTGGYASQYRLSLDQISLTAFRWGGWMIRDFPYLLPCLLLLGWQLIRTRTHPQAALLFASAVWMAGWAAIFMPWIFTVEYYMLPFAAGCPLFCGLLMGDMIELVRSPAHAERSWGRATLALAALLFLTSLPSNYSNGRLQMTIDLQNAKLMDTLAATVPPNGRVLVNLSADNSYVKNVDLHLRNVRGRTDLTVLPFSAEDARPGDYVIAFTLQNQPMFFVRLGTEEHSAWQRNARLQEFLGADLRPIYSAVATYRQFNVNMVRLACLVVQLDFCAESIPTIDTRPLTYGGEIYQVPSQ